MDINLQTHRRPLSERECDDPEMSDDWNTAHSPSGYRSNDSPSFHSKGSFSPSSSPSKKFIVGRSTIISLTISDES